MQLCKRGFGFYQNHRLKEDSCWIMCTNVGIIFLGKMERLKYCGSKPTKFYGVLDLLQARVGLDLETPTIKFQEKEYPGLEKINTARLKHVKKAEGSSEVTCSLGNTGGGGPIEVVHKEATFTRRHMNRRI
ncbi:hypothetical protein EJB05_37998, partial [Eragrostis curvula]